MEQKNHIVMCEALKNTSQFTSLAKDAGNEGKFLFENISLAGVAQLAEHHSIHRKVASLILVRASAWDAGLILIQGAHRGQPIDVSLSLFFPLNMSSSED